MRKVRVVSVNNAPADQVDEFVDEDEEEDQSIYADDVDEFDEDEGDYDDQPQGLFSTPGRVVAVALSALLLIAVAGISAWLLGQRSHGDLPATGSGAGTTDTQTGVRIGLHPPDFELIDMYTGQPVKLSALRGKPVWINFWASWCAPCKAEMPEMKQLYAKYKDKGLVILGVDDMEDNATVTQYVKLGGYDWTFVIDGDGSILQKYIVTGIPTHVFVDKTGIIQNISVGGISSDMMDESLQKILGQ